ncbi:hypothetical protein A0H81_02290 [Grifola frondosa]|uniref:Uncharacterized protein n=1 Tax=Grifola frondosa TaxID=5627 RepID=A0A1C7MKM2_GRIFR|nr:hypothetical protein A0H81_02290 [Grifola frondosa]
MEGFRKKQDEVRRRIEDRKRQDSMGSSSSAKSSSRRSTTGPTRPSEWSARPNSAAYSENYGAPSRTSSPTPSLKD